MEIDPPPPPPLHADRRRRCREYLLALEEERRKIQVFQRELPLCLDLVTQTIEGMRKTMDGVGGGSEETVSDHGGGPVLEEFMPLKPTLLSSSSDESEDNDEHDSSLAAATANDDDTPGDPETAAASSRRRLPQPETRKAMPDWLQSVQLWSNQHQQQQPSPSSPQHQHQDELLPVPCRPVALSACRKPGGAFQPFEKDKGKEKPKQRAETPLPASSSATAAASSAVVGDSCGDRAGGGATDTDTAENKKRSGDKETSKGGKDKEAQSSSSRKPRRSWAPELHRRFLQALQQLGGSHVATPKQIKELMKVDGLTNDEVKSHLQKYRLHTRRPNATAAVAVQGSGGGTSVAPPGTPQFVVVGGIWVPPPEYAAAAAAAAAAAVAAGAQPQVVHLPGGTGDASGTTTAANKVYAPVATTTLAPGLLQPRPQQRPSSSCSGGRRSGVDACSGSPAVSSTSSQTTSA